MNPEADKSNERDRSEVAPYDPPRVETVLTAADLAREVLYAGKEGSPHET